MGGKRGKSESAGTGKRLEGTLFGRRKSRPLRKLQAEIHARLLPELVIDIGKAAPGELGALFPGLKKDFCLEIGFGGGEHLAERAISNPETGFIGCEPFINGMAKLLAKIDAEAISNIRVFDRDAGLLLSWLPEQSLAQVDLLYPDPWPKKRHLKRRFVNKENLEQMHRVLLKGGEFRFASDIEDYVQWTLDNVASHGGFVWETDLTSKKDIPWEGWYSTRYETKAIREGRKPAYLVFRRK
ncbi:MAG: tRNA (guanosine(46)-N7)-methyltransferase TrmB [Pseudomonadota bacterium]